MTYEKSIIEKIEKQKSYANPESAQDQANSLESLSTDIYTDSQRFIYELLQNADDASSSSGQLEMLIKISGNYLTVSHQGEAFSEIDIESICSVGDGNKKRDENKTGFKGIGFKSVFSHSDYVIVNSRNYCFRFDKRHWSNFWGTNWEDKQGWIAERQRKGKEEIVKMPWQIIPIWTNLEPVFDYLLPYNVSTILHYANASMIENELFELFSNTQILLFLRSKEVKITISGSENFTIEKVKENDIVKLRQNGRELSEWLFKSFQFEVDEPTRGLIKNDVRIPRKLREASLTEISFAVQLDNGRIKIPNEEKRPIFTYLPTSVSYDFPFLINASFLTDAGRQNLHDYSKWNIWLFKQIPIKLFSWLSELANSKYKNEFLRLIPYKFSDHSELKQSFNDGFEYALDTIAIIPNKQGALLKAKHSILDKTSISNFLDAQILINFINNSSISSYSLDSLIPYLEPLGVLRRIGVEIFDVDRLGNLFASRFFRNHHKLEENFSLINFLYEQSERLPKGEEKNVWNHQIQSIPFIFDKDKSLKNPQQIYFPDIEFSTEFIDDVSIVHHEIMNEIEIHPKIKQWLNFLGVKEPSDISFIEKSIIGNVEFITTENAVKVGRYLFGVYKKRLLTSEHLNELKAFKILTKQGNLIEAQNAFLSDFFQPTLRLESIYNNDFYVSENYAINQDHVSEWRTFFLEINVSSTITLKVFDFASSLISNKFQPFSEYFEDKKRKEYSASRGGTYNNPVTSYQFYTFSFFELTVDYMFSKLFWKEAFNFQFNRAQKDKGFCYVFGYGNLQNNADFDQNLFEWAVLNKEIIPTTLNKNYICNQTLINSPENKEIAGKYLPVFDYEGTIPENWVKFLPFKKSLDLDDYLEILSAIWKDAIAVADDVQRKENKKRIEAIYEKLASNFLGYSNKLQTWASKNKFLAKDGKSFYYPTDLAVVTVEGFNAPNLAYCDEKNEQVVQLLKILGIKVIDNIKPHIPNSLIEIQDLKRQLKHILPLIAALSVEKSSNRKDWQLEYNRLKNKLVLRSIN